MAGYYQEVGVMAEPAHRWAGVAGIPALLLVLLLWWWAFPQAKVHTEVTLQPGATITYRTEYRWCGHHSTISVPAGSTLVGADASRIRELLPGWHLRYMDASSVLLVRSVEALCPEDAPYRTVVLREGRVAVYYGRRPHEEAIKEITHLREEDLLDADKARLRQGVVVRGDQEVRRLLEGLID